MTDPQLPALLRAVIEYDAQRRALDRELVHEALFAQPESSGENAPEGITEPTPAAT